MCRYQATPDCHYHDPITPPITITITIAAALPEAGAGSDHVVEAGEDDEECHGHAVQVGRLTEVGKGGVGRKAEDAK